MKRIVFCGGGTAGHVMPNLALIEKLHRNYEIYYIGSSNGIEKTLLEQFPYVKYYSISTTKLKRKICLDNLFIPIKLIKGINQAKRLLKSISPTIIFSKGGFVSVPTCIAANLLKIPVICHESDMSLGLANKIISRKALHVCCSFAVTANNIPNAIYTGTPISAKLFKGNKEDCYKNFNFDSSLPTLLVVGGSLGAKALNNMIFQCANELTKQFNIIHIVGKGNLCDLKFNNYKQLEFVNNMADIYACSDIVLSRAGSNAINEMLALCKPMLLVPLPKTESRGDQIENANYFQKCGFCDVVYQENLSKDLLINKIIKLYKNKHFYIDKMKKHEAKNATDIICNIIKKQE